MLKKAKIYLYSCFAIMFLFSSHINGNLTANEASIAHLDNENISEAKPNNTEYETLTEEEKSANIRNFYARQYNEFINKLNLTDSEKEQLIELLAKRDRVFLDAFNETKGLSLDETRQKLIELRNERDNEVRELLKDEKYQELIEFEVIDDPERRFVNDFIWLLGENNRITDEIKENMIARMKGSRKRFESTYQPGNNTLNLPDGLSYWVYRESLIYEEYKLSVHDLLSEHELNVFEELIKERNHGNILQDTLW